MRRSFLGSALAKSLKQNVNTCLWIWALLLMLLVVSGCAARSSSSGWVPSSEPAGHIHLYRPASRSIVGVAEVPFVYLDGVQVARLRKGCVFVLPVAAGTHRVELRASFMTFIPTYDLGRMETEVGPGDTVFLRFIADVDEAHTFGPTPPRTTFVRVPEVVGRRETGLLRTCPLQ
jgi:hypothetical protein